MEDNSNRIFVNLSSKKFEPRKYNRTSPKAYSYKPDTGFWGSIKSEGSNYFSEWHEEYGLDFGSSRKENEDVHITYFKINPEKTYTLSPAHDEVILQGFQNFLESHPTLSVEEKRRLLVELIKSKKDLPNIEHVICQIDFDMDLAVFERIFGGFSHTGDEEPEVFENLGHNVRRAFVENFSGVEVTGYALNSENGIGEDLLSYQFYTHQEFPNYTPQIGFWDMHSIAIFDTDAIDITEEKVIPSEEVDRVENEIEGFSQVE